MKKIISVFMVLLCVLMMFSGCSRAANKAEDVLVPTATPEPTKDPIALEIEEFFAKYIDTDERPIAVMVDNDDKNARPHAGLNEAYLIYEMVVEGGATRFLAVFKGVNTEKIGPVRSSRHYFLDFVMENQAIYTHFGWSPKAIQDISAFGIEKINGVLGGDGDIFWRERKYKGDWHSAYTNIEKIKEMSSKKGFSLTTEKQNGLQYAGNYFNLPAEKVANKVTLPYSQGYVTGYTYNAGTGLYEKFIGSEPHVMQNGEVLAVKNIIVELIEDTSLGDGSARRELKTTGTGKGYYITNGAYEEITWSKNARKDITVYKKADGTELKINPGKTIVNIIAPSRGVEIQ